jgi:hypothetical protein
LSHNCRDLLEWLKPAQEQTNQYINHQISSKMTIQSGMVRAHEKNYTLVQLLEGDRAVLKFDFGEYQLPVGAKIDIQVPSNKNEQAIALQVKFPPNRILASQKDVEHELKMSNTGKNEHYNGIVSDPLKP